MGLMQPRGSGLGPEEVLKATHRTVQGEELLSMEVAMSMDPDTCMWEVL